MSVMTSWHPRSETIAGGATFLTGAATHYHWLDGFMSIANTYITPLCSLVAAATGALFGLHGLYRWLKDKKAPSAD